MLYLIYQSVGTFVVILSFPFVLFFSFLKGRTTSGLGNRYGLYSFTCAKKKDNVVRIWIHAASVGEVQAARILINELISRKGNCEFFLSTMTSQGRSVASRQLPQEVTCFLAPLDAPVIIRRFLSDIQPDMYVCLETELWPAMFVELHRSSIPSVILNGRMTSRSFHRYAVVRSLVERLLEGVSGLAVISREDGERFQDLGAPPEAIEVTGNMKYDYPVEDTGTTRKFFRSLLRADNTIVFVCGSTRSGEEELLCRVYFTLQARLDKDILWIIAPRHLERLEEVQKTLARERLDYDLYSEIKSTGRSKSVVLVDTMGDLAEMYSAGDVNFVGGSLVDKRGHNLMEAARWGRPVYYGSSIDDFEDAADMLENAGGGFRVADSDQLAAILVDHLQNKQKYNTACERAAHAVSSQRGAAGRQVEILLNLMQDTPQNI